MFSFGGFMARGSLSVESTLIRQLEGLGCSHRSFCALAGFSPATLSEIFAGKRDFTASEQDRVEWTIQEMVSLREDTSRLRGVAFSPDWSDPQVGVAITTRKVAQISREDGSHEFDAVAEQVTDKIAGQA
jgi:hypothetical protein